MMRLTSASSVTDIMNTIWSVIYFIPCLRGTATDYSHGLGISPYVHYLETKLEGIRCLNLDRLFDLFVFLIWVYVEVRGENVGNTNETKTFWYRPSRRSCQHAISYICTTSTPQWKGTMALRMLPSSSNSQIFCLWWQHFGHPQIVAGSSKQSNFWCLKHYKFHLASLRRRNEMKPFVFGHHLQKNFVIYNFGFSFFSWIRRP